MTIKGYFSNESLLAYLVEKSPKNRPVARSKRWALILLILLILLIGEVKGHRVLQLCL